MLWSKDLEKMTLKMWRGHILFLLIGCCLHFNLETWKRTTCLDFYAGTVNDVKRKRGQPCLFPVASDVVTIHWNTSRSVQILNRASSNQKQKNVTGRNTVWLSLCITASNSSMLLNECRGELKRWIFSCYCYCGSIPLICLLQHLYHVCTCSFFSVTAGQVGLIDALLMTQWKHSGFTREEGADCLGWSVFQTTSGSAPRRDKFGTIRQKKLCSFNTERSSVFKVRCFSFANGSVVFSTS